MGGSKGACIFIVIAVAGVAGPGSAALASAGLHGFSRLQSPSLRNVLQASPLPEQPAGKMLGGVGPGAALGGAQSLALARILQGHP